MNPPAGWHPDPYDPAIDRYWDGTQWTGHTRPKDTDPATQVINTAEYAPATEVIGAAGDPANQTFHSGNEPGLPAEQSRKKKPKWPWIVGGVLAAFIGVGAIGAATEKDEAESVPAATTTSAAPSTTMSTATTLPVAPPVSQSTEAPRPTTTPPPVTTTAAPAPITRSLEYSCSDAIWREKMGAEGDELCGAPWNPRPTQPAPAYTPPPAPTYTPPAAPNPRPSAGTVHPGSFCATPGATGVTTTGKAMVCGVGSDGRDRWKSAG